MALRATVLFLFVNFSFDIAVVLNKAIKKESGGVKKTQNAILSVMKHQEVSERFSRCLEAPGSLGKAQHQTNNDQRNKIHLP